jgi:predicted glycosyltransferase involved in capsule biosynthesis
MIYLGKRGLLLCNICCVFLLFNSQLFAQTQKLTKDSIPKRTFIITPRINSAGHFPFSGALLNKNANFDLNIFYENKGYGFFIFQSFDLEDKRSFVNYLQPGIFKKFILAKDVQLRLFAGYVFSQTNGFRDEDSDYFTAAVVYWTIQPNLKFESTSLFFDFNHSTKLANRFLMSYSLKGFRFDGYVWYRAVFEQNTHALSASLALHPPKAKIVGNLYIQTSISYIGYLTDTKPSFALRDGFLFSVAFPLSL